MKIEISNNKVNVNSLEYGACFLFHDDVYMRCLVGGNVRNINLATGLASNDEIISVFPIKLKAVIDANPR